MPIYKTLREYLEGVSGASISRDNETIKALAKKSGVSVETIYRCALGPRIMSRHNAELLCKAAKSNDLTVSIVLGLNQPKAKTKGRK